MACEALASLACLARHLCGTWAALPSLNSAQHPSSHKDPLGMPLHAFFFAGGNLFGFKQSEQRESSTVPMMPIRPGLPPVAGVRILTTELHDEVACQGGSLSRQPCRLGPCRLTKPECHNFAPALLPSLSLFCVVGQLGIMCTPRVPSEAT